MCCVLVVAHTHNNYGDSKLVGEKEEAGRKWYGMDIFLFTPHIYA